MEGDDERTCCMGAVIYGECTCWRPVFDKPQASKKLKPTQTREDMCKNCAFRKDSLERAGDEDAEADWGLLLTLVYKGTPFYCHKGMRRRIADKHPDGTVIPADPKQLDYQPPIVGRVPLKADGTPADICAGWSKMRRKFLDSSG